MLMAPLVRRTWSPRGQTPRLSQCMGQRRKVSVIAALCVSPKRQRVQLFFRLHPDENIATPQVIEFLRHLSKQLHHHPVVLLWDRLRAHRAKLVSSFLLTQPHLHIELLPPYAPELNPVEGVWAYLKMNPMAQFTPADLPALTQTTRRSGRSVQRKQTLLRSFLDHSPLPLQLT